MKQFRKPYLAILLAFLTLFASCSQYDNESEDTYENIDLSTFVSKHIENSSKIIDLIQQENNVEFNDIMEITNSNVSLEELETKYKALGVKEFNKIAHLTIDLLQNSNNFVKTNSDIDASEIENLIITEIDNQLTNSVSSFKNSNCEKAYQDSMNRCHRNYIITTAISAAGMFLGGIAGAVGVLAAAVGLAECERAANDARNECLAQ